MEATQRRTIGEMSNDARLLYNYIVKRIIKEKVDAISYGDLSAVIGGRDVQGPARGLLQTARKNVEREYHLYLETIRGEGIKRSLQVAGLLDATGRHIGRVTRRSIRRAVDVVAHQKLPQSEQANIAARLSALGVIELFSRKETTRRLEGQVDAQKPSELPTAETLRLFSNGNEK